MKLMEEESWEIPDSIDIRMTSLSKVKLYVCLRPVALIWYCTSIDFDNSIVIFIILLYQCNHYIILSFDFIDKNLDLEIIITKKNQ